MKAYQVRYADFAEAGARIVAVSVDPLLKQQEFKEWASAQYDFVADEDKVLTKLYGVDNLLGMAKRRTFVIGKDGRIVKIINGLRAIDPSVALAACQI